MTKKQLRPACRPLRVHPGGREGHPTENRISRETKETLAIQAAKARLVHRDPRGWSEARERRATRATKETPATRETRAIRGIRGIRGIRATEVARESGVAPAKRGPTEWSPSSGTTN